MSADGTLGILSVGAGDTTLSFDKRNPAEVERACRIVTDMLRKGYAILVRVGEQNGEPIYRRAKAFDPETCEYIIDGVPDVQKQPVETVGQEQIETPKRRGRPPKAGRQRIPASGTHAVAVGRTAGG